MYNNRHKSKINFNYILEQRKQRFVPFKGPVDRDRKPKDLIKAITDSKKAGKNPVISEVKYRSPTAKSDNQTAPQEVARAMIRGGACAFSVLTEPDFFGGSLETLRQVKKAAGEVPVLRKDFLFHPTQVDESYNFGADSILLISSFFDTPKLRSMIERSRSFGMEPLVEVHSPVDIQRASDAGARLFAVNNRDKDTLEINMDRTREMAPFIHGVKVSASGIETKADVLDVLKYVDAVLIGTSIMRSKDVSAKVAEFVEALR